MFQAGTLRTLQKMGLEMIRVLVVDDHPIVREGLKSKIEQQPDMVVAHEAERVGQALACLEREPVDVGIIDISLKGRSGIELIKQIRRVGYGFPILVLSIHDETTYAQRALNAGAQGYLLKNEAPQEIIEAMRRILGGEFFVSRRMMNRLLLEMTHGGRVEKGPGRLSDRELEVLEAIGRGQTTRWIAASLSLSVSTIETHKSRIKTKLGLKNASELAAFATRWSKKDDATA